MSEIEFIAEFLEANTGYAAEKFADRAGLTVTSKRDANDMLTEVDLTLQKRAVDQIRDRFPADHILAEEGEFTRLPKDKNARCWVIDPIDGTNNFVRGMFPIFAISIGFASGGMVVAAGVAIPGRGTILLAEHGGGAAMNGQRLQVSSTKSLAEARLDFDFSGQSDRAAFFEKAGDIVAKAGQLRCHGSAVASICQVSTGDVDAYLHMTLSPWDYAAGMLLVEEAGGICSRLNGAPLSVFDGKKGVVISNPVIHHDILDLIR